MAIALVGCSQNPLVLQGQLESLQQQQASLARERDEFKNRVAALDRNNQELETDLAQTRQQSRLLEDQLLALREQLGDMTAQVTRLRGESDEATRRAEAMAASVRQRAAATIQPNNSLARQLPTIDLPGVQIRQDGDVVRVELPSDRLFQPDSGQLTPDAAQLVTTVGTELARAYRGQMIGIEGHTDSDPLPVGSRWRTTHQLSVGRAMAVYDLLLAQKIFPANQMFVAGHGPNHPVVPNTDLQGKQRNRRVEIVVYPERPGGQ